jgi:diguanylate cyclase (GGDEF)-like protein
MPALELLSKARRVVFEQGDLSLQARLHDVAAQALAAAGRIGPAYEEARQADATARQRTEQLVARQLAAQRGRLESERLARENALLRAQADSSQSELANAQRAERLQRIALALGATVVLLALFTIARQRKLMRRIAELARTDALTGVLSRGNFLASGQRILTRCSRDGRPCGMVMLDVDRFKDVNDRYGHSAGDQALRSIAVALTNCLRPGDLIGRYGGEEFAVILPGADAAAAGVIAERARLSVGALPADWAPGHAGMTVSGGIAIATESDDLNDLLMRADRALYRAKNAGRNRMELELDPAAFAPAC